MSWCALFHLMPTYGGLGVWSIARNQLQDQIYRVWTVLWFGLQLWGCAKQLLCSFSIWVTYGSNGTPCGHRWCIVPYLLSTMNWWWRRWWHKVALSYQINLWWHHSFILTTTACIDFSIREVFPVETEAHSEKYVCHEEFLNKFWS